MLSKKIALGLGALVLLGVVLAVSTGFVWLISFVLLGGTVATWWMYFWVAVGGWVLVAAIWTTNAGVEKKTGRKLG